MKRILIASGVVVLIGAGGLLVLALNLGSVVKRGVETFGPKVTGAPVTVGVVTLSPLSGRGSVRDLVIGNPPGFKSGSALRLGAARVAVDVKSLAGDVIRVRSVVLEGPEITFEPSMSGSNLSRLQKSVQSYSPPSGSSSGAEKAVTVDLFKVTGAVLVLGAAGTQTRVPLPDLEVRGLDARSPAEAAAKMLGALSGRALQGAAGAGADTLQRAASGLLRGLLKR